MSGSHKDPASHGGQLNHADHDDSVAFLLAELTNSRELISFYAQRSEKRVDVLLVILTAVVAGLALLSQAKLYPQVYWMVLAISSLGITILSLYTTLYVMAADLHAVDRGHTIQRIRTYFVVRHPDLYDTVMTPNLRADGSIVGAYGNWRLSMLVCAVAGGSFVAAFISLTGGFTSPNATVLVSGCFAIMMFWLTQELWLRRKYNSLERALQTAHLGKLEATNDAQPSEILH